MLPVNLSAAQMPAYHAALCTDLTMVTTVDVLDMRQQFIRRIGPGAISEAQVDILDGDVRRSLALTLDDDGPALGFDTDAAWSGLAVLLQAWCHVHVPALGLWASVPVGRYRPTAPTDAGGSALNQLEAQDKACLHLRNVPPYTIKAGTNRVEAIRSGLIAAGETQFSFPPPGAFAGKVGADVLVGGDDEANQPWKVWVRLAQDEGLQLAHDGLGRPWLRPWADETITKAWDASTMTAPPTSQVDLTELRNAFQGVGKSGKYRYVDRLRADQPGSPEQLAFGGIPWESWAYEQPDIEDANMPAWVARQLAGNSQETETLTFTGAPAPHVEPSDWCTATWRGTVRRFRLDTSSLPLTPGAQTVGWTARTATLTGVGTQKIAVGGGGKRKKKRRRR